MKTQQKKRQGGRVRYTPDKYGNTNTVINVNTLLLKQNNSSVICVMTFDNAFANYSVGILMINFFQNN